MDSDGNIWIRLGLDKGQFQAQLEQAKESIKRLSESAEQSGSSIDTAFKMSTRGFNAMGVQISQVGNKISAAWSTLEPLANQTQSALKQLKEEYERLGKAASDAFMAGDDNQYRKLKAYQAEIGSILSMYEEVNTEIGKVTDSLVEEEKKYKDIVSQVSENCDAHTSLRSRLQQVRNEMQNLIIEARQQGGETAVAAVKSSDAYQQLQEQARNLGMTINEVNKEAQMLAGNTAGLQGVVSGWQGLVGGFSAVQGAIAIFGGKSEELQKVQTRVQGCIAAMMGLQQVMKTLQKNSAFMLSLTRMKAAFLGVSGGAKTATGSVKALWATLKANPLGLILSAITAIVTAVALVTKRHKEAAQAAKEHAEAEREASFEISISPADVSGKNNYLNDKNAYNSDTKNIEAVRQTMKEVSDLSAELARSGKSVAEHSMQDAYTQALEKAVAGGEYEKALLIQMASLNWDIARAQKRKALYSKETAEGQKSILEIDQEIEQIESKLYGLYGNKKREEESRARERSEQTRRNRETQKRLQREYEQAMAAYRQSAGQLERQTAWDIEQIGIDAMESGLDKTLKQLDLNHRKEIAKIEEQEKEKVNEWRKLKAKEWAAQHPKSDSESNPYNGAKPIDENSGLSSDELESYSQGLVDIANSFAVIRENENAKWKQNEREAIAGIIEADSSYFAQRIALEKQYNADRAKLMEKGASDEQLALFDQAYRSKQKELFDMLLGDYVGFQQQLTNTDEEYSTKRAELEAAANAEADPKKKAALQASLKELEKQYKQTVKNLQQEFIRNNIGDVFNEQTVENIEEAKRALDEMEGMSLDDFNLAYQAHLTADEFDSLKQRIREVRNELRDMSKGYSLKEAFSDAFTGKTKEEVQRGVDYLVNGLGKVSSIVGGLADAMREFAEATNNAKLEQMADTFQDIADTISTAGSYAAAGAQIGGGWGAVIGAVLGIGQGVLTGILESDAQRAEEEEQRTEEAHDYLSEVISGIGSLISSVDSLHSTISSLDYGNYRKSLLDAINSLRSDSNYDSESNWRALRNGADTFAAFSQLDWDHLWELFRNFDLPVYREGWSAETNASFDKLKNHETLSEADLRRLMNLYLNWGHGVESNITHQYANQENHKDYELDLRRKALIEEMNALYEQGSLNAIEYFNILLKGDQLSLDLLRQKRNELLAQGYSENSDEIVELDNKIAEATYSIQERVREMFEGLAGIDMQSLANKWLDIFKEFGDNLTTVFKKIDESIDDMIKNIIYQTVFVQPLMQRLNQVINNYQKQLAQQQGIDTSVEGWQANVDWSAADFTQIANDMRATGRGITDLWEQVRQQFSLAGLGWGDSANDRSAQARGIATASQDSVDELNGRATTIQGHTFTISENSNIIRDNTNAILGSVRQIEIYTERLVRIDNDIHNLKDTIEMRGVKIRN